MVVAAGALAVAFTGVSNLKLPTEKVKCTGIERWDVKTLQDEEASQIDFDSPKRISFSEIVGKERTEAWATAKNNPRLEDEFEVYTLQGRIPFVGKEEDGDIHIQFVDKNDPKNLHLVAEIPNPNCEQTKKSPFRNRFQKARNEFLNKYQDKSVYSKGEFEITGVLMHDKRNHGKGGNQEGVELHPVLAIKKINN